MAKSDDWPPKYLVLDFSGGIIHFPLEEWLSAYVDTMVVSQTFKTRIWVAAGGATAPLPTAEIIDQKGLRIRWENYNDLRSPFGWIIALPEISDLTDEIKVKDLRPVHWLTYAQQLHPPQSQSPARQG